MPTEPNRTEHVITQLVRRIVSRPEAVAITRVRRQDVALWSVRVDAGDVPKVVGSRGTHVLALDLLAKRMAAVADDPLENRVQVEEPRLGEVFTTGRPQQAAYDAEASTALLHEILTACGIAKCVIETSIEFVGDDYEHTVRVERLSDYYSLVCPRDQGDDTATLVGAIGTLFRAAARNAGAKATITIRKDGAV